MTSIDLRARLATIARESAWFWPALVAVRSLNLPSEFPTSVGVTLLEDDSIEVIAPHGLDDLFAMVVRRNPARVSIDTYRRRTEQKQYEKRWPGVTVVRLLIGKHE